MIRIADFFCGVGGIRLGFEMSNMQTECVFSNEIDSKAIQTYNTNFEGTICNTSIAELDIDNIPDFDIFIGGFPCQSFSLAGNKKGFLDERGALFFDIIRILEKKKPKVFFLENVKNLKSHDTGNTYKIIRKALCSIGYYFKSKIMNSCEYGNVPQNRERIYLVGFLDKEKANKFRFPKKIVLKKSIKTILDSAVHDKYYYKSSSKIYEKLKDAIYEHIETGKVYQYRRHYVRENKSGVCPTLTANMGGGGHNVPIILDDKGIRKLTPRECFNLQGFPKEYYFPEIADCHLYKQAGNSVTITVITRIANEIYKVL
jgi:DNA (cytosine-5)-methyltransferase 1